LLLVPAGYLNAIYKIDACAGRNAGLMITLYNE
jgi:hypothetical protein